MLDFRRAAMSQVEWGPSMETAHGTRQNATGGKLENNILVQEIDLSYAILRGDSSCWGRSWRWWAWLAAATREHCGNGMTRRARGQNGRWSGWHGLMRSACCSARGPVCFLRFLTWAIACRRGSLRPQSQRVGALSPDRT